MTIPSTPSRPRRRVRHAAPRLVAPVVLAAVALGAVSCGDDAGDAAGSAEPSETIRVTMVDYDFSTDVTPDITAGETVRFVVENKGALPHDMQVLDADGQQIDATTVLPTGGIEELVVTFEDAGRYQLICDVDDHLTTWNMRAIFEVTEG